MKEEIRLPAWLGTGDSVATQIFALVLGAVVGSFLNVCIWRIPQGESVVYPPSHCPHCGQRLKAWQMIPILSYLLLRGRCAFCSQTIGWIYPTVEALGALSLWGAMVRFGPTWSALGVACLIWIGLVVAFIDLYHYRIPDSVTITGMVLGIMFTLARNLEGAAELGPVAWRTLEQCFYGAVAGGGFLWLVGFLSRGGMGGGDIKWGLAIGLFLGWQGAMVAIFVASLTGALVGLGLVVIRRRSKKDPIAFGPFLSLGAVVAGFWGQQIWGWYQFAVHSTILISASLW